MHRVKLVVLMHDQISVESLNAMLVRLRIVGRAVLLDESGQFRIRAGDEWFVVGLDSRACAARQAQSLLFRFCCSHNFTLSKFTSVFPQFKDPAGVVEQE